MRLGLCCKNNKLHAGNKKRGIPPVFASRTCRMETIIEMNKNGSGFKYAMSLFEKNLDDLFTMIKWNEEHGIRVLRMSSDMAPHITNHRLFSSSKTASNPYKLAWSMKPFRKKMREIGKWAMSHGHRLTFHPGQFVVIGSPNAKTVINSIRDLHWHATVMDMMGLDMNCVINIHGGGIYGDKEAAISRWVDVFDRMPAYIKRRLVIENDEKSYSIEDVLEISRRVKWAKGLPVTFDIFHYYCYNATLLRRHDGVSLLEKQRSIEELLPEVARTWGSRRMKMHISEQARGNVLGAHAKYVRTIPKEVLVFSQKVPFDLYIEAKAQEKAVLYLMKKYKRYLEKNE